VKKETSAAKETESSEGIRRYSDEGALENNNNYSYSKTAILEKEYERYKL
jgi:hypothetical protein